jgi:CheY-like chemotaxis protein
VRLPLAATPAVVADGPRTEAAASGAGRRRILIIDDNADAAESLAMLLRLMGHTTRVAHSGKTGLEAARGYAPEIVFLDIGMPEMNGYEVARRLAAEQRERPATLVAITGWASDEDRQQSRAAGFDFHLTKPVETEAVERLLGEIG